MDLGGSAPPARLLVTPDTATQVPDPLPPLLVVCGGDLADLNLRGEFEVVMPPVVGPLHQPKGLGLPQARHCTVPHCLHGIQVEDRHTPMTPQPRRSAAIHMPPP
jgi:hypothetical protein